MYNNRMKNIFSLLANLIYRKKCYVCSKSYENKKLCSNCYEKVDFLPEKARVILGKNVYCATYYHDVLQKIIRGIKYHKQKELAYYLAKLMYEYWVRLQIKGEYTIIPVPLSKERQKKRRYNQVELVAQEFSKLTGYKINTNLVERVKDTKPQYNLNRAQRIKNLANAFRVNKSLYNGEKLLIIDDICTTGATFETLIKEFQKDKIEDITCFATATVEF